MSSASTYIIPDYESQMSRAKTWSLALVPIFALVAGAASILRGGDASKAFDAACVGGALAIPVVVLACIVLGIRGYLLMKLSWGKHTYSWYRDAFPHHAHANGHVSCRNCGSHKTNVRNLMQRTYMRVHSCSQCGETL